MWVWLVLGSSYGPEGPTSLFLHVALCPRDPIKKVGAGGDQALAVPTHVYLLCLINARTWEIPTYLGRFPVGIYCPHLATLDQTGWWDSPPSHRRWLAGWPADWMNNWISSIHLVTDNRDLYLRMTWPIFPPVHHPSDDFPLWMNLNWVTYPGSTLGILPCKRCCYCLPGITTLGEPELHSVPWWNVENSSSIS